MEPKYRHGLGASIVGILATQIISWNGFREEILRVRLRTVIVDAERRDDITLCMRVAERYSGVFTLAWKEEQRNFGGSRASLSDSLYQPSNSPKLLYHSQILKEHFSD